MNALLSNHQTIENLSNHILFKSLTLFTALLARRNKQIFSYCFNQNETLWCDQVSQPCSGNPLPCDGDLLAGGLHLQPLRGGGAPAGSQLRQLEVLHPLGWNICSPGSWSLHLRFLEGIPDVQRRPQLRGGRDDLYILGLRMELERPVCLGSESSAAVEVSGSSSMVSIFGFGYDDDYKWTFAWKRPLPREDPENVKVKEKLKEPKNEDAK